MNSALWMRLAVGASVGAAAGYLGSLMITRRMALAGDALGHVALPGMGLALVAGLDPSLGAFVFLLAGILVLWQLERRTELAPEALVGVLFVSSLAIGFLIVPQPEPFESLIGDISKLTAASTVAAILISIVVVLLVRSVYAGMMLLSISEDLAAVRGVRARRANLLYLLAIALIVSLGVKVTGSLLVGAEVILPAAVARLVSSGMRSYAWTSAVVGVGSSVAGILAAAATGFAPGPAIVLVNALLFVCALAVRRRA